MATIKVKHGDGPGLCGRCREAQVLTYANNVTETLCHSGTMPLPITAPVVECSHFDDRNAPSRWDMEKIAWTLLTDRSGQKIGFAPPKKDSE